MKYKWKWWKSSWNIVVVENAKTSGRKYMWGVF